MLKFLAGACFALVGLALSWGSVPTVGNIAYIILGFAIIVLIEFN